MGDASPRIAFFGNVANAQYQVVRALRRSGIDAHQFVCPDDPVFERPESIDPDLAGRDVAWIHDRSWVTPAAVVAPWRAPVTRALADFDVVVASGPAPMWAQFTGRPWCFFVTGADLTMMPFPITFRHRYHGRDRIGHLIGGAWQRRAVRRADQLWLQPFAPMREAADRLGVAAERRSPAYFPLIVDTDEFRPGRTVDCAGSPTLERMAAAEFVVLHPTRMVLDDTPLTRRTGQLKANDVLIEGFARFVRSGRAADPLLVIPDITLSPDLPRAKALVTRLRLDDHVLWAEPPAPAGFPRHALLDLYALADVVGNDFGVGWFGYVAVEGAAVGLPVVTHLDQSVMTQLYPGGHPFVEAATPDEVADRLTELWADPAARRQRGEQARRWALEHHSAAGAERRYVEGVEAVLSGVTLRPRS